MGISSPRAAASICRFRPATESQAKKHCEQSKRYRERLEREKRGTPEASKAAVRRTNDLRGRRLREIREEEERDREPTPPAVESLVSKIMGQNVRIRMGLLCEIAMEQGLRWRDVPPAGWGTASSGSRSSGTRSLSLPRGPSREVAATGRGQPRRRAGPSTTLAGAVGLPAAGPRSRPEPPALPQRRLFA